MTPLKTPASTIFQINLQFLVALVQVLIALWIWPHDLHWWGLGLISILCAVTALALFIQALKSIWSVIRRERAFREILARGKRPKSAQLADEKTLEKEEMV